MSESGRSLTFEDYQEEGRKPLSSEFIAAATTDTLTYPDGGDAFLIKSYLDNVPADQSDREFGDDEQALTDFRSDLADFIGSNLGVVLYGQLPPDIKDTVRSTKAMYLDKLQGDKKRVADWMHAWRMDHREKMPAGAVGFHGFSVKVGDKQLDLTDPDDNYPNLRSTIMVQRQVAGQFVQWDSPHYLTARARNEAVPLTRRIYLNPRADRSVDIFQRVVSGASEQGLKVNGKILDRSLELMMGAKGAIRGDGIVLYAPEDESDGLLRIVEGVYKENFSAFKGRKTSRIPLRIADGVAIGSQPNDRHVSLTSHRADILGKVAHRTREATGVHVGDKLTDEQSQRVVKVFRDLWPDMARAAGIDPDNLAFNSRD